MLQPNSRTSRALALFAVACAAIAGAPGTAFAEQSIARQWNELLLDAIRRDIPKPTVHARNLFHFSIAVWDAWAAYDKKATGYLVTEKHLAADVQAAREEAISYAAYRVLVHRYQFSPNFGPTLLQFRFKLLELGYDPLFTNTVGDSPAALGNRIGQTIIDFGMMPSRITCPSPPAKWRRA